MTPEQCAVEYLEKHGMIPGYDFVPSTATTAAAKLYTELLDEDRDAGIITLKPHTEPPAHLRLSGWPGGEPLTGEL